MSEELKPCPFCGSDGEEIGLRVDPNPATATSEWNVQCYVCNVETAYQDNRADAVATWNRRAHPMTEETKTPLEGREELIAKALSLAPRLRRIVHAGLAWPSSATLLEAANAIDDLYRIARAEASQARQRELEEALRPFAVAASYVGRGKVWLMLQDLAGKCHGISVVDSAVRKAASLLNSPAGEQPEGWRDIASAPTNTSILVFIPNAEHYGYGVYRAMLVDMGTGRRWMTSGVHVGRDLGPENYPTHWMPLPTAPCPTGGEG